MGKAAAIINSTSISNILPCKSEQIIAGRSVLEHIVGRLRRVSQIEQICLATSDQDYDDKLCSHAAALGLEVYRGSPYDLISRTAQAAYALGSPYILKVMGNYPLIDPEMTSQLIWEHIDGGYDYSFNEHSKGVLFGMGCEVITAQALFDFNAHEGLQPAQRMIGTLCFLQNRNLFKTLQLDYENPRPSYKVCLENDKDRLLIEEIFKVIKIPRIASVIDYLDAHPIVAHSNHQETIKEVGLEKMWLFPEKVRALQESSPEHPDCSYPISVELSLTNRCNLECIWCSDRDLKKRLGGDLDFDVFKKVISDLKAGGTTGIVIEGGGEPLLHEKFDEAVAYVHAMGLGCGLITNGIKKIAPETLRMLDWIRVSLDASNEEEYRSLKKRPLFEAVLQNISEYTRDCPLVGIGYVVTRYNIASLEPLVLRLRNMGVNYIQFRLVIDHPQMRSDASLHYLKRYEMPDKFSIISDGMDENTVTGNKGLPCKAHSLTSVITADGGVYVCGRLNKYEWLEPLGNLNKQSFKEIWTGQIRRKQAGQVLDPDFCKKHCPECRLTKFNELFARLDKISTRSFI